MNVQSVVSAAAPYALTTSIAFIAHGLSKWTKARRRKRSSANVTPAEFTLDLAKMEDILKAWNSFLQEHPPGDFEIRDTKELPRKKLQIILALYAERHCAKTENLREGALIFLDALCQYQDGVG